MARHTLLLIVFGIFISAINPGLSYCQKETSQIQYLEVNGSVSEIDVVAGKIALNTAAGIMLFFVGEKTKIMRGTEIISAEDIEMGDPLTVTYYTDKDGNYQAVRIMDGNLAETM